MPQTATPAPIAIEQVCRRRRRRRRLTFDAHPCTCMRARTRVDLSLTHIDSSESTQACTKLAYIHVGAVSDALDKYEIWLDVGHEKWPELVVIAIGIITAYAWVCFGL